MTFFDTTQVKHPEGPLDAVPGRIHDFEITVPDGWQQGAGAFGGWVMAVLVRGIEACVPGRALRSLTAEIPAPVKVGAATLSVETLRTGQSVTVVAARLTQKGALHAHAVAVLGEARALEGVQDHVELTPPDAPGWRTLPPIPLETPGLPTFLRHFELRLASGVPYQGASRSGATGWVRLRDPGPVKDSALVVAHVDAWWPAEFARLSAPHPMVTSAFTLQMVGGPRAWTTDAPLLHTSRSLAVRDGYVTELRELWTEDGQLVALNQQTLVIVK